LFSKSPLIPKVGNTIPSSIKPFLVRAIVNLQKLELLLRSHFVSPHPDPIFLLGNQKAGTSAIAALLGQLTGHSTSIDLAMEYLSTGEVYPQIYNRKIPFSTLIRRNRLDFSRKFIKEANLTVFKEELQRHFPKSKYVFIVRNPLDNIRSILNRLNLPGDLDQLDDNHIKTIKKSWMLLIDGSWLGLSGENYIDMLAARWKLLTDIYIDNIDQMILIKYEDFLKNKIGELERLVNELGFFSENDISANVDIQYQPAGNKDINLELFFGKRNFSKIEMICGPNMEKLNY